LISSTLLLGGGLLLAIIGYILRWRKAVKAGAGYPFFSLQGLKDWWADMWGANALQGQFGMLYIGMATLITDLVLGNKINFDQFKTFSQVLIFLPLILPAAGIDARAEGFAKWVLTFGTSFVFGGYPGFLVAGIFHLGDQASTISSISVACSAVMTIGMYWSFFHVGHLSRFYLFFEYNVFKDPTTPPAVHTLMLTLIYECNPSLVRQMLRHIHRRDIEGLMGPLWYDGVVAADSLWAQMVTTVMGHTEGWSDTRKGQQLLFIHKAHLEMIKWAQDTLRLVEEGHYQKCVPDTFLSQLKEVLGKIRQYVDPPAPAQ